MIARSTQVLALVFSGTLMLLPLAQPFSSTASGALTTIRGHRFRKLSYATAVERASCSKAIMSQEGLFADAPATLLSEVGQEARDRPGEHLVIIALLGQEYTMRIRRVQLSQEVHQKLQTVLYLYLLLHV